MDTGWLLPIAMIFGLAVGIALTAGLVAAQHRGVRANAIANATVPDGIAHVVNALDSSGLVVDGSNNVVVASNAALATGLIAHGGMLHADLVDLASRVRRSGEVITREVQLPRSRFSDSSIRLEVRLSRIGARYVLLLAEDKTEMHRLEEVRRDFVANVSHELKTPIGSIGLLAEALESAADDPGQVRRFASRMRTESDRLARLTKELIELSRLQAADALARAQRVELDAVLAQAVDRNRVIAESRGVQLVTGGDRKAKVVGDETLLVTAVHNLIANAVQHSPDGGRIGIGVNKTDEVVEIAVTDQGSGIAEVDRDRVFERFYRVDSARTRESGGSGLGLSIVKHVVQNHGGEVRLWSQPGRGSTFTIRLPRANAVDPEIPTMSALGENS